MLLHAKAQHPWTIAELAKEVGVSRSALMERFTRYLSEPPMAYLIRWRLHLAARALAATSRGVAQIASDVGYESEAAFNRAFKREFGLPPARYRREHRAASDGVASRHARMRIRAGDLRADSQRRMPVVPGWLPAQVCRRAGRSEEGRARPLSIARAVQGTADSLLDRYAYPRRPLHGDAGSRRQARRAGRHAAATARRLSWISASTTARR